MKRLRFHYIWLFVMLSALICGYDIPLHSQEIIHSHVGESITTKDHRLTLTITARHQQTEWNEKSTLDKDIQSPKSAIFLPDGSKYYVQSLEGSKTVVYDASTNNKLKTIEHLSNYDRKYLWGPLSGLFPFRKYMENTLKFRGKPVESTFSHNGRYLWITYYRRSFDLNGQEPSAIAIIDTRTDSIVRLMDSGPIPKMIVTSHNGKLIAVTHWGDNTVGLIDCSSSKPKDWHYVGLVTVLEKFKPDFSLTKPINRDKISGLKIRGTVFLPGDRYLLAGCMTGGYGIAVIDIPSQKFIGFIKGMHDSPRHLLISKNNLYLSINATGYIEKAPLEEIEKAIEQLQQNGGSITLEWKECKIYPGARTIAASPDGNFIFASCSFSSKLIIIDSEKMAIIGEMPIDSYPVGLAISPDGKMLVTTSQGIDKKGGNAVNVIKVEYNYSEEKEIHSAKTTTEKTDNKHIVATIFNLQYGLAATGGILLVIILFLIATHKRKK